MACRTSPASSSQNVIMGRSLPSRHVMLNAQLLLAVATSVEALELHLPSSLDDAQRERLNENIVAGICLNPHADRWLTEFRVRQPVEGPRPRISSKCADADHWLAR